MRKAEPDLHRLRDEAIDLMIRLQNDPDNPVTVELVRAWRARGAEHEKVWDRVSKIHGAAGEILNGRNGTERGGSQGPTRRNVLAGGAIGLAALGAGYAVLPGVVTRARADYVTAKGEMRRIELPDGSAATLGPDSALVLDFKPGRHGVELLAGMSYFETASDTGPPLSVTAAGLTAVARGTSFDVFREAGFLGVSVGSGVVDTHLPGLAATGVVALEAGNWLTFDRSTLRIDRGTREIDQIGAWRDNLLIAEREPVAALVARIGKWIPGRIVMADPFIGDQQVSGIFDVTDPRLALEAAVHPTGARVRQVSSYMTVISPL